MDKRKFLSGQQSENQKNPEDDALVSEMKWRAQYETLETLQGARG